ncbi:hypothetical protein KA531_03800, partial [Candidatus Saccharibacteria bacterium]|nr:hypothetical protein [Candidatus Saccharibacteria bacterium]
MNPPAECNEQFGLKERKEHDPTSPDRIVRFVAYVLSGIIRNKSNQCVDTATLRTEVDKYADTISTVLENASPEQFNTVDRQKLQQALGSLVKEKLRVLSMQNTTNSLKSYPKILELYWLSRKSRTPEQIEAKLQKALAIANHFKIPLGVGLMLSFQGASVEGILSLQNSPVITNAGFSNADLIKVLSSDLTAYSKYTLLAASNLVLRLRPTKSTLKLVTCSNSIFDIHTKLEVMLDDEFKELKDQFRGSSFGLALQTGSAEDLRAKLKVILDDEFKELKDQFRGSSFGLALQAGSA